MDEPAKKRFFLVTYGCQMNERDSEVVAGMLASAGFERAGSADEADVVIFNTCSVRQHAEDKVWSEAGKVAKQAKKRAAARPPLIGIIGCMAQNYKEKIFERAPHVNFVVGPADIARIPEIVRSLCAESPYERKIWETGSECRPEEIYHTGFRLDSEHAFVVISEGCSNFCAYCVVPYTRGPLRHRAPGDILSEIEQAAKAGVKKVTLLGQNVNAYSSGGMDLCGLMEKVDGVEGLEEFSFITSHPRDTTPRLFETMAALPRCRKYLHLPVQSGSDRVLKLMNRGYDRKFYLDLCRNYRKIVSRGVLTTDVIVGFPTETEEDFLETYGLLKEVEFDAAFLFKYSPRPHSAANEWQDDVPQEEKERRHALVLELQRSISLKRKRQ